VDGGCHGQVSAFAAYQSDKSDQMFVRLHMLVYTTAFLAFHIWVCIAGGAILGSVHYYEAEDG
jgi:hypothetical protein